MIGSSLKLGIAAGVGYTIGGRLGVAAIRAVAPEAAPDTLVGAQWAGRIVTFLGVAWVLGR